MNEQTGQSEDLNQVEETGSQVSEDGANIEAKQGGEGDKGDQGQPQSKTRNAKQRLRRKLEESETRNAQLAEDNRKLNERLSTLETQVDGVVNPPPPRPSRVDFDTEEDYEDALYDYRLKTQQSKQKPEPAKSEETQPVQQEKQLPPGMTQDQMDTWLDRCDDAAEKYDDYDEVVGNPKVPITAIMADAIRHVEQGAEVAYFLGKNPAEAQKIAQMPIYQQGAEITRIAGTFTNSTTTAPEPITPPGGGDDTLGTLDPQKMTPEQYRDWRRSQGMGR